MEIRFPSNLYEIINFYAQGLAQDEDPDPRVADALKKKSTVKGGRLDEAQTRIILDVESAIELSNHLTEQGHILALMDPTLTPAALGMVKAGRIMSKAIRQYVADRLSG